MFDEIKRALPSDFKEIEKKEVAEGGVREVFTNDDCVEVPSLFFCLIRWNYDVEIMTSNGIAVSVTNSPLLNGINLATNTPSSYQEFKKVGSQLSIHQSDYNQW